MSRLKQLLYFLTLNWNENLHICVHFNSVVEAWPKKKKHEEVYFHMKIICTCMLENLLRNRIFIQTIYWNEWPPLKTNIAIFLQTWLLECFHDTFHQNFQNLNSFTSSFLSMFHSNCNLRNETDHVVIHSEVYLLSTAKSHIYFKNKFLQSIAQR